jgi:eukaryotic-like serine/threonine-protein kinase
MSPDAATLATLSRLLDEGMDLAPSEVEPWLDALPPEHRSLAPRLRVMLARHGSDAHADFIADGPKLSETEGPDENDESLAHAGDLVGPYRLLRKLGQGGMGTVWLAERAGEGLKREVALKLPRLVWGAGLAERMARERDIGALLEHPSIARLYDAGLDEQGRPYLAFEYIDGQPIDIWCSERRLDVRERLQLMVQVTRAVTYAHGRLVVHRDIKPSNVLVTEDGQPHLLDFGIAKLLDEGAAAAGLTQELGRMLTPQYASPEQLKGETITVASDVYGLGVLSYELLTGKPPYQPKRKSQAALEEEILEGEAALASARAPDKVTARALKGEVDAILAKALKHQSAQRYATADALADDIERHLTGERVLAQSDSAGYRLRKVLRRHWIGVSAVTAVVAAVMLGSVVAVVQAQRAAQSANREQLVKDFVSDVFRINLRRDPANAELRQLPADMLVNQGATLIQTQFSGQPALQAELYGMVAGVFADMGAKDLAKEYAARQVATLDGIRANRMERASARLGLARALFEDGCESEAKGELDKALALADPGSRLQLHVRILRAQVLLCQRGTVVVDRELAIVEAVLQRTSPGPDALNAKTTLLRALRLVANNRLDEGILLMIRAVDEALASEGAKSATAIEIRLSLSRALSENGRLRESRQQFEAALAALRAQGGPNAIRAALLESDVESDRLESGQSDYKTAASTIERNLREVTAGDMYVPRDLGANVKLRLGSIYLYAGNIAQASKLVSEAADVLRPIADSASKRIRVAQAQANVAILEGHHSQADALLHEVMDLRAAMSGGTSLVSGVDHSWLAWSLQMQGRFDEALEVLASSPQAAASDNQAARSTTDPQPVIDARADVLLDAGDPAAAIALIPPSSFESEMSDRWADYRRLTVGAAMCASHRTAEGLALLLAGIAGEAKRSDERSPIVARNRAIAGICALSRHQRRVAELLASQARTAFLAQPGVSSYFKKPSEQLDRLLSHRASLSASARAADLAPGIRTP